MNTKHETIELKSVRNTNAEKGNVLITALIILVLLTLIGIFATQTAQMDLQIAANEIPYKRSFYICEAGLYRQAAELARAKYSPYMVKNIDSKDDPLVRHDSADLPDPSFRQAFGEDYDFEARYAGFYIPPEGYSAMQFSRYDFEVDVEFNNVPVWSRLYKIGPKAE